MSDSIDEHKSATILPFRRPKLPNKRGRPKSAHRGNDSGTPELVMKRLLGETTETLDLCLERSIITEQQHWCGIHLRWLYTLRHGVPCVRAMDPSHTGGNEIKVDDPEWREQREKEYHEAVHQLTKSGHALLVLNVCIYNQRPRFLKARSRLTALSAADVNIITNLRDGLDILAALWGRKKGKGKK